MPAAIPEPTNGGPPPDGVHPVVHRLRTQASDLRQRGYGFKPYMQEAQKVAAGVEFASESEQLRDMASAARRYTADAREAARGALAEARGLAEKHADLFPLAAAQVRKRQEASMASVRARGLPDDLRSRFQAAAVEGFGGGNAHLQLAIRLQEQYTREQDPAALRTLREVARPILATIGPEAGDDAFRARDMLRTWAAADEADRGDLPRLEAEQDAISRELVALESEVGKLAERLNVVYREDRTVWGPVVTAPADPRRALDAVPDLFREAKRLGAAWGPP
jgi:hypothetical protein